MACIVPAGGESKHVESGFPVGVRLMCDDPGGGVSPFNGGIELQVLEGISIASLLQRVPPDYGDEGGTYTGR